MKKLQSILLVDDNASTNFLHQMLFNDMGLTEETEVALNGKEALDYLMNSSEKSLPELMLLDVNMPNMNGFEFLEHFNELEKESKNKITILMVTSSLSKKDIDKSQKYQVLKGFVNKPLTKEKIREIWTNHFNEQ